MQHFHVNTHEDGITLLKWMKAHMPHVSRGMLEKGIRKGWVKVDKKKPSASTELAGGQVVMLAEYLAEMEPSKVQNQKSTVKDAKKFRDMIIFENDELIAINKPAGLAVQGGSKQKVSVDSLAQSVATDKMRPRLVHRLDKDTSGVLILAKTAKAATRLTKLFASKEVEKKYTALLVGVPKLRKGKIDLPMLKEIKAGRTHIEDMHINLDEGKDAVTLYEVTHSAAQKYAWVDLYPITGRTHQLRVHMAAIHHPIVGDGKYGGKQAFEAGGNLARQLHLHAASIKIPLESRKGKRSESVGGPALSARSAAPCKSQQTFTGAKQKNVEHGDNQITIKADLPKHMQQAWEWTGA